MSEASSHDGSKMGYGMLGLTWRPNAPSLDDAIATLRAAVETNSTWWNGGEFYGPPDNNSLTLARAYFTRYPEDADKVVLNVKGAVLPGLKPDGTPEGVRRSVENCLRLLGGTKRIDQFECARRDPDVPVAQTIGALKELVEEGKIGGVALSEVSAATIREAAGITKIVAVEVELSLFSTEPLTNGVAEACAELGIPIIAYSPVGRGMLSGQIKSYDDIPENDVRRILPRFQPENFETNMKLVRELEKMAKEKNCTAAQLAIGWLRALSKKDGMPEIIPVPGASSVERVKENALKVELGDEEMKRIDDILAKCEVVGDRYHAAGMKLVDG